MKIYAFKYNLFIIILSIIFAMLDLFLILYYGYEGQLSVFLYVIIGVVPLCGISSICVGMSPTIIISKETQTIKTLSIADERYKINRSIHNTATIIYFDEIENCIIEGNKLIIKLRYGHVKTLYLNFFTKSQIEKMKKEIDKIIK